ncbi:MAG: tetratricopeptide repeat protein [bacterium]
MARRSFAKSGIKIFFLFLLIIFCFNRIIGTKNLSRIESLEKKLKEDSNNLDIILPLAESYYKKGIYLDDARESFPYFEGAIFLYKRAFNINKDPKTAFLLGKTYFNMAKYLEKEERGKFYKEAQENFLFSYNNGFVDKELFILLGHSYLIDGFFDKSIEFYSKALLLDKKDPIILSNLAFCYKEKGDLEKALSYLKIIDEPLDKETYIDLHLSFGDIYEKKGLLLLARKEYSTVLKKDKGNEKALRAIKRLD